MDLTAVDGVVDYGHRCRAADSAHIVGAAHGTLVVDGVGTGLGLAYGAADKCASCHIAGVSAIAQDALVVEERIGV